jgi:hypothetical protein
MSLLLLVKWIHVLSMIGVFGGLLIIQLGLPPAVSAEAATARRMTRILSLLLGLGLLAGVAAYGLKHGHLLGPHFNGVIGFKFALLVAVGGLLPLTRKEGVGPTIRWIAIILLAMSALAAGMR